MSRTFLVIASLPLLLGAAVALGAQTGLFPPSIFVLRLQVPASLLALVAGVLVSAIILLAGLVSQARAASIARALARERQSSDQVHRRFIHRLNHELKNPLTAVRAGLANLDLVRDQYDTEDSLANVRQQVDRLARLVESLRKLADLDVKDLEIETLDLAEVLVEAADLAQQMPGREGREIRVQAQKVPWPLSPIQGDRDLLLLAIYNLLDNAIKFSNSADVVEVRASEDGTLVTVEVADTGPGIATQDLPHVTEELYRGQGAQGIEGAGLGLALVERIAVLHGADLSIRSREGQGTVATLRLPMRWR